MIEERSTDLPRPATRPTIILAYGDYGHQVLYDLLSSSSERGLLEWLDSQDVGGKRVLRNLELFWLSRHDPHDYTARQRHQEQESKLKDPIYWDLYQKIRSIQLISREYTKVLDEPVVQAWKRLHEAGQLIRADQGSIAGLDVIFIASPYEDDVSLSDLDGILRHLINTINNNDPRPQNQYQSAPQVNFIEILDYEGLFSHSRSQASWLYTSIRNWQDTRQNKGSNWGPGKVYVCDSQSGSTFRRAELRRKEVVLFLEFMLFEGMRESELSKLFQSAPSESILSAFGIRLGEQNIEALSQYAAAEFAKGWIGYLAGKEFGRGIAPEDTLFAEIKTNTVLASIDMEGIAQGVELTEDIKEEVQQEILLARNSLAKREDISPSDILERMETVFVDAEAKVARHVAVLLADVRSNALSDFRDELSGAIDYDLNHSRYPVPVGKLIDIIKEKKEGIERSSQRGQGIASVEDSAAPLSSSRTKKVIGHFYPWHERFIRKRVDKQKNFFIWPVFAVVLSMLYMPDLAYMLLQVDDSSDFSEFSVLLSDRPFAIFLLLFVLMFLPLLYLRGYRYVSKYLVQSNAWFIQPDRGRLVYALDVVSRNDELFQKIHGAIHDSLYSEIQQSLHSTQELLETRRSEMRWLVRNLTDFQTRSPYRQEPSGWDGGQYRYAIRKEDDLENIQATLPAIEVKYSDRHDAIPILFDHWEQHYDSIFLSPLELIRRLSQTYSRPAYTKRKLNDQSRENINDIVEYLKHSSQNLSVGIELPQQGGLYEQQQYALLSDESTRDEIKKVILQHFTIKGGNTLKLQRPLRVYLLTEVSGIDIGILAGGVGHE